MAERVGFEPTVPLQGHAISSRAYSATLAPLRQWGLSARGGEGVPATSAHLAVYHHVKGFDRGLACPNGQAGLVIFSLDRLSNFGQARASDDA